MVLHLITETFYCTHVAHCFDTLCYIFLTWSMLETLWKNPNMFLIRITLNWIAFTTSVHLHPALAYHHLLTRLERPPRRHVPPRESGNFLKEQCTSSKTVQAQVSAEGGGYWWWKYDEVNGRGSWISCSFGSFCFRQTHRWKCSKEGLLNLGSLLAAM